jgi:nucleoside-diphosphate-sugar epimerase
MEYDDLFNGSVFDVGTGDNISLNEIKEIVENFNPNVNFDYVADRPGDVLQTRANIQPLKDLGWSADIPIKDGISECFRGVK